MAAQPAGAPAPERIALVNATVVNVRTGTVQDGQTLVLSGGRIESIGDRATAVGSARHRHPQPLGGARPDRRARAHRQPAADARGTESGVTTVRSAGVSSYVDVGLRELVKHGHVAGPDVVAAGYHVRTQPAPEMFISIPISAICSRGVTTIDAMRRVVRANLSHGVDWIKVTRHRARRHTRHRSAQADVHRRGAAK